MNIYCKRLTNIEKMRVQRFKNRLRRMGNFQDRFSWKLRISQWKLVRKKHLAEGRELKDRLSEPDLTFSDEIPF